MQPPPSPRTPRPSRPQQSGSTIRGNINTAKRADQATSPLAQARTISQSLEDLVNIATNEAQHSSTEYERQAFQSQYNTDKSTPLRVTRQEMEQMQRDLRIACEVGQQLLKKNEELASSLEETENARERLVRLLEEERSDVEEKMRFEEVEKDRMRAQVKNLEEQVSKLKVEVRKTADVQGEAAVLRDRVSFLDGAHQRLEESLTSTNKELRTVSGERKNLMVTVQELYDQLTNFREINKNLKSSCQKQVGEYSDMMVKMQDEKLEMALQMKKMSEEITRYKRMVSESDTSSSTQLGENSWLTKSIQSIVNEVKMQGSTLVQQRESSDLEALKSALATAEAENQELNDLIQRQQDALQCHEEEHNALLSKLAEFERDSFLGNDERSGSGERLGIVSPRSLRSSLVRTGLTVNRKAEGVTLQNFNEETDGADGISVAAQLAKTIEEMEETARIFEQQLSIVEKLPPLNELLAFRGTPDTGTKKMDRAVAESLPSAGSQASTRCTPDSPDYTKIPDELKREVALLRQRNLEVNAELSRQTIQIADLNWKIRDLESEKAAITERKETLEQEITVIRNAALQGKPLPPRSLEEDIQNDLDDLAFKLEESEKKFSQAKSRIEKLEKDNNQLHHSLSISESRALDLQGKLNQAHSQKAAFDRDVEAVLGVEKELSINPSTTSVHVYRSALVKSQSIIQRLTSDLAISNQDRARMRESITTLGAQLAKQASLLGEIEWRLKDADAQHSSAATRMALAEEAKNALEEELKDANEKMRSLALAARGSMIPMPASASASATGATLASLVETQKQFDQSLMAEARAKEDMIGRLQAEYDIVREELDSSKDEVDRLGHEISTLRNLLAEQKQTVGKAADRIMDAAKELHVDTVGERDDIRVKELEAQVQRLQIEKRVLNDSLTTLGAQLSLLSTKKGEDDWNIKEMVATKNQLAKANDDLKQEVLALSESLRVTEEKLNRMQARKDRSQPVSGNGRDIHEQLEEAKEKQEQLKAALRRYEQQADLDLQEIEDLRSKLTDMARENIQLAKQVDDVKAELSKVSISSTKIVSVGSDKFFSASDVVSKGFAASHETAESHEKARFYEAIIEDLETKLKIASGEIAKERSMTSLLKGQLRLVQESLQHLKRDDNRASRSERRSVDPADNDRSTSNAKCSQCVELQGRIRDILERNYSNIPDASAATAIPQNPPSSHTRNITGTTTSETTERTDRRIDELLDQLADLDIQLQQERCAAEHDRSTWDKERQDLEFKLDRARTVAEESKAALEVAQIEINNKKNVLLALKHAADAEKALKTNALNTSLSDAPDLGSCDFLASKLTKSSELELKIQSLLKDNLMLQEKRLFLENKVTEAEKENETIQKELHQAENLHVQHFLERASLSEKVAQLQREISIILSPPKDGQYIKDTKPNDKGKEKEKEKEKSSSFRRMSKLLPKSRRSSSSMEVTSEQLDEKLKALQAEKDNLEKEFHRNAQRVADAHAEAAGLKEKLLETERAFKVSKKEFKRKLEEADEFARATEANQNEVEECLKSQIQELTDRLMEPADSPPAAALLDDIIKHQTRIRDLEVKCDETAKRLFEADVQNENLLSQSKRLQSDFGALQSKYEVETSLLKNIIKAAHQMIENLETGNGDQAATAMEQLIAIRSEVDRFSHIITETEERWHQVSKQNVQLIRELSRTREELFSEQKRAREKSEELRGSINDLNAKGRTANELEKQIKEGRQRETTLQENIREMQLSMEKMKKSYEKDADMHTQRIKELERAIVNARLQVGSLGAELDKTKDEVQELTRHRKVLEISLIEREREFQESMNELKARQSVGIPKSLPATQRSNLVPDIKITSESQEDNKFTTNEKMWELDLAKSKSQMLCWASWKLAQNVHSFTHHTDGGDQASVEVRAKMAVPPPPSPSEESTLAYVMILLAKAEEGVTAAGDDLASYMSKAGAEDSRWKNIEASLKSERDELKHRLNDLEHLLTDSQRRCTELEGEKVRVQSRAAAALAAQSESQQRLDEGRESRTDLQARVKSLMEERTSLRAKIEDQCTQIVNLEARIHTITTERSRSSTEAENLRDEIARVRVEMEELESMRKRRIQELESEVNKSCSSLARDEIRLMAAERELASARGEVAMLIAKVTDLTAEATRSLERYKEMCRSNGELERTLVTAKAELQAKETAVQESELRQKRLETQLDRREEAYRASEDEKRMLQNRISDLEKLIDQVKGAEATSQGDARQLSVKLLAMESRLSSEVASLAAVRESVTIKDKEIGALREKVDILESREQDFENRSRIQAAEFEKERHKVVEETAKLKLQLTNSESDRRHLTAEVERLEAACKDFTKQLIIAEEKFKKLQTTTVDLQKRVNELTTLKSKLESERVAMESTSTSATSKVMHLEAQVEDLRQRLESSLSSNGHLTKTIQELRENLRYVEDCLQGSTDTNNRRVREMEARLETAESESRRYDAKARDAERECEELRDSLRTVADDRGGQIQKLTQSMMHMREKISSLEDEVFDAMERAKAFEVASTSAREEAGSLRLALQKAEASRDLNEDQFKTLAAERTAVVEEYQKRASDLEARVKVLDGKLADAESQLMVQKEEAFKATKDVAEARKAFKEKSQALSQFQSETAEQIASKASTIETLRAKLHQAEEGVRFAQESEIKVKADKDKALATAKMEVQQLKDRIQSLEEDLKESRQSFDRLKERTDLEASDTSERMKELLARLSSPSAVKEVEWVETRVKFEREVATLRSELSVSQSGFKDLEKRGKELRDTYEQKLSHRAKEVQELQSTVKELEAKIRKSDDDKNLREEVKKIKDDYALIKNQLAESEDRKRELLAKVAELKQRLASSTKEMYTTSHKDSSDEDKEIKSLRAKNSDLEYQNRNIKAQYDASYSQTQSLLQDLEILRSELKTLQSQITNLTIPTPPSRSSLTNMLTPTRRTRSQSVSAASQKPRLFRRNSSLHDLEDVVSDLRTKVSTREEEIAEVRRWLTEAETEAEGLKERLERVEAEREEAMLEIDELRRRADRVIDNDMPSRISVDTTLRSRRTSSALSSATTAVQSPGSPKYLSLAAKKSLEVGESAVVDKASLVYLQRMSTQMLCCFFFVFAPITFCNMTGSQIPEALRITSQVMGGVTGAILLNRPRKNGLVGGLAAPNVENLPWVGALASQVIGGSTL